MSGENSDSGVKKRQPVLANTSFNSGYSTDQSQLSQPGDNSNDGYYRKGDKKRKGKRRDEKDSNSKASVIWMVLVIGLTFCLMDAAYIVRVLDRGTSGSIEAETAGMAAGLVLRQLEQQDGGNELYIPQTRSEKARGLHRQDFSEADASDTKVIHGAANNQHPPEGKRPQFAKHSRAERLAKQKKEKEEAEAKRIKNIKMAALEALKAEHGGKLPDDLIDKALNDEEAFRARPMSEYKGRAIEEDKKRVLDLFEEAGLKEMDDSTFKVLPKWSDVKHLYGDEPVIVGLDQCKTFRAKGEAWEHFVSTAGMFNSGTNLMAEMLIHNCHMEARMKKLGATNRGIRWQVPWGKHTPPGDEQYRVEHKSTKDQGVDANMILPAVTVRDPYYWMQSMCKHHYTASWRGSDRCPNLIPSPTDKASWPSLKSKDYFPLSVRYADFHRHHKSLTGLWNDWYNEYKGVEFQRLFVRYEDLLFHPKNVTTSVCECAGGVMNKGKFQYQVDSAKKGVGAHGNVRTGYVDAIIKYGSERHRYNGYIPEDLKYARENLDTALMGDFRYKYHPMNLETSGEKGEAGEDGGNEHLDESEDGDSKKEHAEEKEEPEAPPEDEPEKSEDIGDKNDLEEEKPEDPVDEEEEAAEAAMNQ